jgi:putative transposase
MISQNENIFRKKMKHYNISGHAHELTFSCHRKEDYLLDSKACEFFITELVKSRDEFLFKIWAYVLMPNHVHLLLWPLDSTYDIAEILSNIKGRMSKYFRDFLLPNNPVQYDHLCVFDKSKKREVFRFWQPGGGFDRNLWDSAAIYNSIQYIEANPVRKRLSLKPIDYRWSSAYARKNNIEPVPDLFDIPIVTLNPQLRKY